MNNQMASHYQLSEEEKQRSLDLFKKHDGNLIKVIRELWNSPNEKGTTSRGRAIREFWIERGLKYRTKVKERKLTASPLPPQPIIKTTAHSDYTEKSDAKPFLSLEEQDFIKRHYTPDLTKKEVAKIIWPEESKRRKFFESQKFVLMSEFINNEFDQINLRDEVVSEKYSAPRALTTLIRKINKIVMKEFDAEKLSMQDKKCLEKLLTYLSAPRFIQVINSYITKEARDLFESEYIRSSWDKPDLTSDELNLYINVCMDYVNLREIEIQKQKLNQMFDETEGQNDLTMRLTEMLKTKAEEYNQCTNRIDKMLAKLNGERSKRIQNQHQRNASIISLVQLFQDEQERKLMIQMADMQKKVVYEEADKMEKMSEWKARVLGISKNDAI
jgi:hypothetical protein